MDGANRFLRKISLLFRRKRFRNELDEEMAFHREQMERDLASEGVSADEAHYAAVRQFGNTSRMQEQTHKTVRFSFEVVLADARYAVRQLRHSPGFTLVMLLTLGLSIGANCAIFSVIDGVLLKKLPYAQSRF